MGFNTLQWQKEGKNLSTGFYAVASTKLMQAGLA